jgi:hypothetical protein
VGFDLVNVLSAILGGNIGDLFSKIVGTFKLSPEDAAKLEQAKLDHALELAKLQAELEQSANATLTAEVNAARDTITAEAKSGDKFTSRARPTFLYLMYVVLAWNYLFLPAIQYFGGRVPAPIALPDSLMWLFGSGYLGYTGARSWDKFSTVASK